MGGYAPCMRPHRMLAQCTVTDLNRAEAWYGKLFEREPDAVRWTGLIEWHFGRHMGLQIWYEPDRAGRSTVVLDVPGFGDEIRRLKQLDVAKEDHVSTARFRVVTLHDPDDNRVVLTGD